MSKNFKPMLACRELPSLAQLNYPVVASPKIDGIRCVVQGGQALSRTLKPIPNKFICELLSRAYLEGLDGELVIPDATFQETTSVVMSHHHEGTPRVEWHVFDRVLEADQLFGDRFRLAKIVVEDLPADLRRVVKIVPHVLITCENDLLLYEATQLSRGFEGVMVRDIDGPYKFGRSTMKEGYLLKVKRFEDAEAVITGYEEKMHNANEAFTNELGQTKRSSAQAGKVATGVLGAFVVNSLTEETCAECKGRGWHVGDCHPQEMCGRCYGTGFKLGVQFNVGSGFTDEQRKSFWRDDKAERFIGKLLKYKHLPHGAKTAPRHPVFLGFRDARDM